jgi:hypothetical protein
MRIPKSTQLLRGAIYVNENAATATVLTDAVAGLMQTSGQTLHSLISVILCSTMEDVELQSGGGGGTAAALH